MFKRRLAVLGAVAVLAITGVAGSAMADQTPAPTAGSKVVCTTSDGKTIELTPALPAKDVLTVPDGKAVPAGAEGVALRVVEPGDGAEGEPQMVIKARKLAPGEVPEKGAMLPVEAEAGHAVAAEPAEPSHTEAGQPPKDGVAKTVSIHCKKAE
ncbi:hypothetical protein AB0C27_07620 [Nonomuraea sp. NPDC048882]|uniref:hypothetical protein n=1 Tax=unclassified Nonomuraea TaxID=2593643 RepID=UPI00340D49AA